MADRRVLFVCTGNTCRSPLAEALCKARLAARLGVAVEELGDYGFRVQSAGVAALPGDAASPEAIATAAEYGVDLTHHRSRGVRPEELAQATDVIAMTESHALLLASLHPGVGPPPRLLCGDDDLPDPIGGDLQLYRACASVIVHYLDPLITEWLKP